MKNLYLFDFDGTLTFKDSLFDFLRFYTQEKKGAKSYWVGFLKFVPLFVLIKLGVKEKAAVKESFISYFLKGESRQNLQLIANKYANKVDLIRPKAKTKLKELQITPDNHIYMVSASNEIWLQPISEKLGMNLICTQAQFDNDIYAGKFLGNNCNYEEKKNRIQVEIDLKQYDKIYAYGDSNGDKAMFSLADESFFKPFE